MTAKIKHYIDCSFSSRRQGSPSPFIRSAPECDSLKNCPKCLLSHSCVLDYLWTKVARHHHSITTVYRHSLVSPGTSVPISFFSWKKKVDLAYIFSVSCFPTAVSRAKCHRSQTFTGWTLCFSGLGSEAVNHTGCSAATDLVLSNPLSTAYLQIKCREALAILANCVWRSDHTLIWYEMFDITSVAHRCILYLSIVVSIHCCMYALLLFLNVSFAGIV